MERFTALNAIAAPMWRAGVSTDEIYPGPAASPIIRARGMAIMRDRANMGLNAFAAERWDNKLQPRPDFILNRPPYDAARILIARENFGCGSSREMAVWCLYEIGIRCIIAPSFGEIFYNNCFRNGLLPIRLAPAEVEDLLRLAGDPGMARLEVDLPAQTVTTADGGIRHFALGEYQRELLLQGLDEISATLSRMPRILAHEAAYLTKRPWLT